MRKLLMLSLVFLAVSAFAQIPLPCPVTTDPTGQNRPPIEQVHREFSYMIHQDRSISIASWFKCRDADAIVMWTWRSENCDAFPCDAALWQQNIMREWFPRDVPHSCDGCVAATSTEYPLPFQCGMGADPLGLGRLPLVLESGLSGSVRDGSAAVYSRFVCRDDNAPVAWTFQVLPKTCNGPCDASKFPAADLERYPLTVPHVCDGCVYPYGSRRRAVH